MSQFIKISTKCSISDLMEAADNWRNRSFKIRDYFADESKDEQRRIKALSLWRKLCSRIFTISDIYLKQSMPIHPEDFKSQTIWEKFISVNEAFRGIFVENRQIVNSTMLKEATEQVIYYKKILDEDIP